MKGISFQNGIEFKLSIEGESFTQGSLIKGGLSAGSKSASLPIPGLKLILAEGVDKKIKLKAPDAFRALEEKTSELPEFSWEFLLSKHARITDTKGSLYLLYGNQNDPFPTGVLKLSILPHPHIREFCDMLNTHGRFITKTLSAGKEGTVEIKFGAPEGKEWTFLEQLLVSFNIDDEHLHAHFEFTRKEIDAMKAGLSTKTTKRKISRSWELTPLIHDFNQRLNKEVASLAIDSVLSEYKTAGWLAS